MDLNTAVVIVLALVALVFTVCFCTFWCQQKEIEYIKAGMIKITRNTGRTYDDGAPVWETVWVKADTVKSESNNMGSIS